MVLAVIIMITGLALSAVAIYYSVIGLAAIFSTAAIPIVIMGTILEVSKLVTAWWLKANWYRAPIYIKSYMFSAVIILMLITSMGIFGFLSKAHNDQLITTGDVQSKLNLYDEKIKLSRENIELNRTTLKQLDAGVDQTLARSTSEQGAERSIQIRRQQGPERQRLLREIETEQRKIIELNEQRALIAAEVRKVEAEVGPIKYIAALIYGNDADENLLEKSVTWVIIVLVLVFDPLAVLLLLASQMSFQWIRDEEKKIEIKEVETTEQKINKVDESSQKDTEFSNEKTLNITKENHAYLYKPWVSTVPGIEPLPPQVYTPQEKIETPTEEKNIESYLAVENINHEEQTIFDTASITEKEAMHKWKSDNPNGSLKVQRGLMAAGKISELPWQKYLESSADQVQYETKKREQVAWMEKQGIHQVKKIKEI